MEIMERVQSRLRDEPELDETFLIDAIITVKDRLGLILGGDIIPIEFNSIIVEAVVKMYRRRYFEGIENESVDSVNTKFVDNVLAEYEQEINAYIARTERITGGDRLVRFI